MPNLIHGQDPGGALRPIQVDDNGNLAVDLVSGVSVSTTISSITSITDTVTVHQVSGSADSSEVSGIARQTNPSAVADAAVVKASFDDLGRQVITPYQVRDLVATAYVALVNGTETNVLAGVASTFLDLMQVVAANNSDAAVSVNFRDKTDGGVVFTLQVPANSTAGFVPAVPYPQDVAGQPWTADMGDITGTTVSISALFIKNI